MNLWHEVSAGEDVPRTFNVIIENPRGNKNKYEIDKETGLIKLDRPMKTSQDFPFDYGFIPQTYWHDNDPLDVIVLSTYPLHPGVLVEARAVAVMRMIDCGDKDEKIIAVPVSDPRWDKVQGLHQVNPYTLKEFTHFWETYKTIEDGKKVEIKKIEGKKEALDTIREGVEMYKKKFGK
jgi:inorganic pyrophosphatase